MGIQRVLSVGQAWRFFALTFLWSWLFWGIAAVSGQEWSHFPAILLYILGGIGPSLVAIVLVYRGYAIESIRDFLRRTIDIRRIPSRWYLAILAIALLPNLIARLAPGGSDEPEEGVAIGALLVVGILAGFAEELGWRGYAIDRLLTGYSALVTSLIIGLAWTLWHLPFYAMHGTVQNEAGLWSSDFWFDMTGRIPLAILFAWVYLNTNRSILAAILLHAADNIASVVIAPSGDQLVVRLLVATVLAVAVILYWGPRTLQRTSQPHRHDSLGRA